MKKTAFVFSGQGAQTEGMGKTLFEKYEEAREMYALLDDERRNMSFEGSLEEISKTEHLQPIMVCLQLALWKVLTANGVEADAVCGLSLGEYSALTAAGVMTPKEAMEIIALRGKLMAEAATIVESGMCAVIGSSEEALEDVVKRASSDAGHVYVTNVNSSRQIVLSGEKGAVERAQEILKGEKVRVMPLNVSGPFHTPYMASAVPGLTKGLRNIDWQTPKLDFYSNVTGEKYDGGNWADRMAEQMISPVKLYACFQRMVADGVERFIEIGSGSVLTSILKKEFPGVETRVIGSAGDVENFLKEEA